MVRQAYDGASIDEIPVDDEASLLEKLYAVVHSEGVPV